QAPTTLGLPLGRWSLAKLRAYLIRQRIVPTISREHLRRVLKKQRPRTRLESQGTHDHYDDARLWSTISCECEDG
ncbi:MAG: hypothetical protein WBQ29_09635, partial [Isosphaeraceae bacterium]